MKIYTVVAVAVEVIQRRGIESIKEEVLEDAKAAMEKAAAERSRKLTGDISVVESQDSPIEGCFLLKFESETEEDS